MSAEHESGSGSEESESGAPPAGTDPLSQPLSNWDGGGEPSAESGSSDSAPVSRSAPAEPPESTPAAAPVSQARRPMRRAAHSPNMLPGREVRRSGLERIAVRLIATCGVVGIGVAIAAIMVSSKSQGWIVGLVVSIVSVVLSALLWSSRQL